MYGYKSQAWKVVLLVKTGDLHLGVLGIQSQADIVLLWNITGLNS